MLCVLVRPGPSPHPSPDVGQVDPVLTTANRILTAIASRHRAGGLPVAAPIVARLTVDLEAGLHAFEQAKKIKEVPLPFSYVQLYALLLLVFNLLAPVAIAVFCNSAVLAVVITSIVCTAFTTMWLGMPARLLPTSLATHHQRTRHPLLPPSPTFTVNATCLYLAVGNELEDPFGCDANDLPMLLYHQYFCRKLQNMLTKNPRDQWTVTRSHV